MDISHLSSAISSNSDQFKQTENTSSYYQVVDLIQNFFSSARDMFCRRGNIDREKYTEEISYLLTQFEIEAQNIQQDMIAECQNYARKLLLPYLMCSPFFARAYSKPLGYPGDYQMVKMMLRRTEKIAPPGYPSFIEDIHLNALAPVAHRNRIHLLTERLLKEAHTRKGETIKILSFGCGPAAEIEDFVIGMDNTLLENFQITLADFNEETLEYASQRIKNVLSEKNVSMDIVTQCCSVDDIIHKKLSGEIQKKRFDVIFCAGLYDYFSSGICKTLNEIFYGWLKPDGLLTITNVHSDNPNKYYMSYIMDWHLVHRTPLEVQALLVEQSDYAISYDFTGINIFADMRHC